MTPKPTPLANWITHYTDNRGGNVLQALHDLATDIGLHDHEDSASGPSARSSTGSSNAARDALSTSRAHAHEKARSEGSASVSESAVGGDDVES